MTLKLQKWGNLICYILNFFKTTLNDKNEETLYVIFFYMLDFLYMLYFEFLKTTLNYKNVSFS